MLPSIRASQLRVEYDGEVFDDEAMLFLVGLTNSVGGFEKLAPGASINDGKFSMFILKKCNIAEFIRVVSLALRGEHVNDPLVVHAKPSKIKVTSEEKVQLNLDGEFGGLLPAEFTNLPRHIRMFVPLDQIPEKDRVHAAGMID